MSIRKHDMTVAKNKAHTAGRGLPKLPLKTVSSNRPQGVEPGDLNDQRENRASHVLGQSKANAEQAKLSSIVDNKSKIPASPPAGHTRRVTVEERKHEKRDEQNGAGPDKHAKSRAPNDNRQKRALGRHMNHQRGPVDAEAEAKRREAKLEKMMLRYDARGNITGGRSKSHITNIYEYLPMDVEGPRDKGKQEPASVKYKPKNRKHKRIEPAPVLSKHADNTKYVYNTFRVDT